MGTVELYLIGWMLDKWIIKGKKLQAERRILTDINWWEIAWCARGNDN